MDKIGIISLGCSKNLVDSEIMLGLLKKEGYPITPRPEDAKIIIINTCCFIEPAKREAIETILEMAQMKKRGRCKFLVVTGCLAQECGPELFIEIPEIDVLIGPGEFIKIVSIIKILESSDFKQPLYFLKKTCVLYDHTFPRVRTTWPHLAYIKISEGCDHGCSYCLIPSIRGRYRSREIGSIVAEAKALIYDGVKEICLIGQDTTAFNQLSVLLEKLVSLEGEPWIRLLYTYPFSLDHRIIELMAKYRNMISYLDIPIQHTHPRVLKAMNRPTEIKKTETFINSARSVVPDIVLRTTVMVGFPGETQEEFEHLLEFIGRIRFDHLGVFSYSREKGTPAYRLPNHIPKRIKQDRYEMIMDLQAGISMEKNRALLGKIQEAICDYPDPDEQGIMIGRTMRQAPEIDGITLIKGEGLKPGDICEVKIVRTDIYDLEGVRLA
ncbi:MAG: 30S ribosomal protein S12 methylthiotransferase RimO [bacterium]